LGGRPYQQRVEVNFPHRHAEGEAIGTLWARARIEELSNQNIHAPSPEVKEEITKVALAHRLVSAYTSFVAVEERFVTGSEQPVLVEVPVEMPDGVSYEGVFGGEKMAAKAALVSGVAPGRSRYAATPSVAEESLDAVVSRPEKKRPAESPTPLLMEAPSRILCRIESQRTSYRASEPIEIVVTFENTTSKAVRVPTHLSVVDGSARFQILDSNWKTIPHPTRQTNKSATMALQPGARVTLRLVINGVGGYAITKPGTYHIVLLGTEFGLSNSNTLTLQILP
jgi:hypothetical protein